ncbi:signal recognition particle-docking protein FtsY [Chondromyces apiculatus]|uniref:Signal recognition particle receptor FtsY n=1 Tax=Chondromyces apiculatus DSM 436 TaxID=1192034 RepID=A0A017TF17_9BACT|nr:signal recognition particle-docking protein FtsY [Chondromyces apiculatus]EYF07415.1 Signal recognition particle receptor protein FtsY (alpha subunit) [Chondromyces apiculatus DSM 436]
MEPAYIVAIVVVVIVAVAVFLFTRKKPELPEARQEQPPKLTPREESKAPAPAEKKTRAERQAEKPSAAKPAEARTEDKKPAKAEPKAAEAPATKPAEEVKAPAEKPAEPPAADKPAVDKPAPEKAAAEKPAEKPAEKVAEKPAVKPAPAKAPTPRKQDVEGLRKGLGKVREKEGFFGRLRSLLAGKKEIDPSIVEQIEEVLLTSDVGVKTTEELLRDIRESLGRKELDDEGKVWDALRAQAARILRIQGGGGLRFTNSPTVVMVVGVNGVGKTTTIGKLATQLKNDGKTVVLAAGDTFRAAAVQQLAVWGKRVGCEVVRGKDGANPGAVIFDAIQRAKEIGADVVLADTAGRLHTKTNLMDELTKVARTMTKALDGAPHETLLVLDATNGQNALQQAAMFKEVLPLTGIVLTKLDGTAKGGVILGIAAEHGVPVRYIGIGERAEDLREFEVDEFVEAMLGRPSKAEEAAA